MFEYELPDVGEGVAEGEVVVWHAEPGDAVEEDDVLAEIETDKAVVDLPAPVDGTINELHAAAGDVVPVGDVIVTIDEGDGEADSKDSTAEAGTDGQTETDDQAETESVEADTNGTADGRVFAPPRVRRLARELGVSLGAVEGSGPGGRVTEGDVRAAAEEPEETDTEHRSEPAAAIVKNGDDATAAETGTGQTAEATAGVEPADRERTLAAPATRKAARDLDVELDAVPTEKRRDGKPFVESEEVRAYAEAQRTAQAADTAALSEETETQEQRRVGAEAAAEREPAATDERPERREPYAGIRETIGEQMEESVYTAPHVTHHDTAVVPELVETRERLKARADERGVSLTYLPFVLKAVVAGLEAHPVLNTSLDEEAGEIVYKDYYNLGVAVATDDGLMVPVVEDVDRKGLVELAAEVDDLAARARGRELAPEEMRGGSFTVTNFGAIGGEYATPIINYPETAVLGLGAIEQRPVVEDGEVRARATLPLSLSVDHRVIDGADAAAFTNTVMEYLEDPALLLL